MTLGEKVLAYRAENIVSQSKMAELCGVDRTTIIKIENGGNPSKMTEWKINKVIKEDENNG